MTQQQRRLRGARGALAAILALSVLAGAASAQELTGTFETIDGAGFTIIVRGIAADGRLVGYFGLAAAVQPFLLAGETLTNIDVPFPEAVGSSSAQGINARGDIVGIWQELNPVSGLVRPPKGYLLGTYGEFSTIEVPGAVHTRPRSINASGQIVGWFGASGRARGFVRDRAGEYHTLEFPGAFHTSAHSINDRGDIVGKYFEGNFNNQGPAHDAFPTSALPSHGFLLTADGYTPLDVPFPGAFNTGAYGINAAGDIVGCYTASGRVLTFVRDRHGEYRSFGAPGASFTCATAINARGDIAGHYFDANGAAHGFVLHQPAEQ